MRPIRTTVRWIFVAPRHAAQVARAYADQPLDWCYFGTNASQRVAFAGTLAHLKRVDMAEELTRVAYEMKQPFLDWMIEIGRDQPDPVSWWASSLASGSPLQTDVFLLVCYTQLVEGWLRAPQSAPARRMIIVEDPWLGLAFRRQFRGDPRVACHGGGRTACLLDAAVWLGKAPRVALATVRSALTSFVLARWMFPQVAGRLGDADHRTALIYTWIRPECFSTPGSLHDPWTGRLETILSAEGGHVTRLSSTDIQPPLLGRLKRHGVPCVVTPRHLRLRDLVRALCAGFRVHRLGRLASCRGWNYGWLLFREILREWGQADFGHYRLGYFAMRRVAARYGADVQCVIYPFENQPWEKLLCLAWRTCAPHVKLIGYQHAWVPPLLLPYTLGRGAEELVPLPDQIVTNSEFNLERLVEGGYPRARLVNGGALRHEYLNAAMRDVAHRRTDALGRSKRTTAVVLVTFPISRSPAVSLLADLLAAFKEPLMSNGAETEPVRFLLKCHPALPLHRVLERGVTLPSWMAPSQAALEQLLPAINLLLYVGPTSAWWEAFLSGVPVLKYQADLIDIDAGNTPDAMPVPTCSSASLRASIEAMLQDRQRRQPVEARLIERMYGRVNEALWQSVVRARPEAAAQPVPSH